MDEERMLTVEQVAERLQVGETTVQRWLRLGNISGVRIGGTRAGWRVAESEVKRFIERQRAESGLIRVRLRGGGYASIDPKRVASAREDPDGATLYYQLHEADTPKMEMMVLMVEPSEEVSKLLKRFADNDSGDQAGG